MINNIIKYGEQTAENEGEREKRTDTVYKPCQVLYLGTELVKYTNEIYIKKTTTTKSTQINQTEINKRCIYMQMLRKKNDKEYTDIYYCLTFNYG